jgi:hypothetical protein
MSLAKPLGQGATMRAISDRERLWIDCLTILGLAFALYLAALQATEAPPPSVVAWHRR